MDEVANDHTQEEIMTSNKSKNILVKDMETHSDLNFHTEKSNHQSSNIKPVFTNTN